MADNSGIEWTDATWNPVTGCTMVSQGCKNCYAARMARRLQAMGVAQYADGFQVRTHSQLLALPTTWKQPKRIFVNSMSDLFHPEVPLEFIKRVFEVMEACPRHTFQVLTKRDQRLAEVASDLPWPDNVWVGVSIENQSVDGRIGGLLQVPAAVRFLSCEPLLGPIAFGNLKDIDWVIVGGESGPKARPMDGDWARAIRDHCLENQVAFFFKQWGGVRKHLNGRLLDGVLHHNFPVATSRRSPEEAAA
jgi:protein gp37